MHQPRRPRPPPSWRSTGGRVAVCWPLWQPHLRASHPEGLLTIVGGDARQQGPPPPTFAQTAWYCAGRRLPRLFRSALVGRASKQSTMNGPGAPDRALPVQRHCERRGCRGHGCVRSSPYGRRGRSLGPVLSPCDVVGRGVREGAEPRLLLLSPSDDSEFVQLAQRLATEHPTRAAMEIALREYYPDAVVRSRAGRRAGRLVRLPGRPLGTAGQAIPLRR